jgi:hypothetical protein
LLNLRYSDLQIADLIKLNRLKTRIGNRQRAPRDRITGPEMMFGVGTSPHADEKFSGLISDVAAYPERVTQIGVAALIERAAQSDPRLYRNQHTAPRDFLSHICSFTKNQAACLSHLYS